MKTYTFLSFFLALLAIQPVYTEENRLSITIINSYSRESIWTESLLRGEMAKIRENHRDAQFLIEYLDIKRFPLENRKEDFISNLQHKESIFKSDLVLINDNAALRTILLYQDELYRDTPIVFAGINGFTQDWAAQLPPNVTGVAETVDLYSTITMALSLHKEAKNLYIVMDNSQSSLEIKNQLHNLEPFFLQRIRFIYLNNLTMDEIRKKLSRLGKENLVLLTSYSVDSEYTYYDHVESARLISEASSVPVYYIFTMGLGEGVLGGHMLDGEVHGKQAAELANLILGGESVSRIPPLYHSACPAYIDYSVFKKWDLDEEQIPKGTNIINKPSGFLEEYRTFIFRLFLIVSILILIVFFLLIYSLIKSRAQKELSLREEDLRITLKSIGDGVIAVDSDGRVSRINPEAERLTGWSRKHAIGRLLNEIFHVNSRESHNSLTYESESGQIQQNILTSLYGTKYPVTHHETPILDDEGEYRGSVIIFRDVSKERELYEQLKQSEKMNAIGQLAGGIAHDFNNMLSGILGSAELLDEYIFPDSKGENLRDLIIKSSRRAADLTHKLLTFAKKSPTLFRELDIHIIIAETIAILENTLDKKIHLSSELKAQASLVKGDTLLLQNALMNLCINSSQAIKEAGEIKLSTKNIALNKLYCSNSMFQIQPGDYLEIIVKDNGCGISEENLPHIFEPFFTTNQKHKGTGLGLAAVYGTVQQHKGEMTVKSKEGKGTTFKLLLPLLDEGAAK
ncbi:MAG: ATP-binding protein [Spirochaetales bacterium]|nr:ATP-binding protein [Spirochaetales bacterium]